MKSERAKESSGLVRATVPEEARIPNAQAAQTHSVQTLVPLHHGSVLCKMSGKRKQTRRAATALMDPLGLSCTLLIAGWLSFGPAVAHFHFHVAHSHTAASLPSFIHPPSFIFPQLFFSFTSLLYLLPHSSFPSSSPLALLSSAPQPSPVTTRLLDDFTMDKTQSGWNTGRGAKNVPALRKQTHYDQGCVKY